MVGVASQLAAQGGAGLCHNTNYLAQPLCLLDVPWLCRLLAQGGHSHAWPALCVGLVALSDTLPWPARQRTFRPAQALLHRQSSTTACQPGQIAGSAEEEGRAQEWQLQNAPALLIFRLTASAMLQLDGTSPLLEMENWNYCDLTGCWASICSIPMVEACPRSCRQDGHPGFWRQQGCRNWCWALDCAFCSASKVVMAAAR